MTRNQTVAAAIDESPLNRGLRGVDWLAVPGNVALVSTAGDVTLFDDRGDDVFEVHFLFYSRGKAAIETARAAFGEMFDRGANLIMGLVPDFRRDVKLLARWAGGRSVGIRQTSEGPCELFVLSREMWSMKK